MMDSFIFIAIYIHRFFKLFYESIAEAGMLILIIQPHSINQAASISPSYAFKPNNSDMKKLFVFALLCFLVFSCNSRQGSVGNSDSSANSADTVYKDHRQFEFADAKYTDLGKAAMSEFQRGDIDRWLTYYADAAVIHQSPVDSLSGKVEIAKLWKERRRMQTGSITIENDIWLPLIVHKPKNRDDLKEGIWLLNWHHVNLEYKNGKRQIFWVHTDFHFDTNNKIDIMLEYFDPGPILGGTN
jgi:hypothetical protein